MAAAEIGVEGSVRLGFTARSSRRPLSSCPPSFQPSRSLTGGNFDY